MVAGKPIVAIIGRPNVGKSTLFNRMAGRRLSIVAERPGTTRDRVFTDIEWQGKEFTIADTGGLESSLTTTLSQKVRAQAEAAIEEADVLVFTIDAQEGITPDDWEIAEQLRHRSKNVVLAANKVDHPGHESLTAEFHRLGLGEPLPVSAYHGTGVSFLLDRVAEFLPASPPTQVSTEIKIAIVGRPNVGKSMLLNALLGMERAIVDETPGTTRDALDTPFQYDGHALLLIDTAGLRRKGRIEAGVEKYSALRSLRAISRADVALLVIDATEPFTLQDMHIAGYLQEAFKGIVIIVNKWDLAREQGPIKSELAEEMRGRFKFVPGTPVLFTSALLGQGIKDVLPRAIEVYEQRNKRVPDPVLDSYIKDAVASHNLPHKGNRELRIYGISQVGINPPIFLFMVNDSKLVHFSYQRFLSNQLRNLFGFAGTPIRLVFKDRGEK